MKKILALLLAGVMTVGLAACGTPADTSGGNSTADNGSAASGDTVVIGVLNPSPATTALAASRRSWVCSTQTLSLLPWRSAVRLTT